MDANRLLAFMSVTAGIIAAVSVILSVVACWKLESPLYCLMVIVWFLALVYAVRSYPSGSGETVEAPAPSDS